MEGRRKGTECLVEGQRKGTECRVIRIRQVCYFPCLLIHSVLHLSLRSVCFVLTGMDYMS